MEGLEEGTYCGDGLLQSLLLGGIPPLFMHTVGEEAPESDSGVPSFPGAPALGYDSSEHAVTTREIMNVSGLPVECMRKCCRSVHEESSFRYSMRIKSCDGVVGEDGYKWRKYGQKSIKNSPNPRCYYRCTNPRCSAKKQVERAADDPETYIVTYDGFHLHFTFPFLISDQIDTPVKKQKRPVLQAQEYMDLMQHSPLTGSWVEGLTGQQGLLEDVVAFTARKPLKVAAAADSRRASFSDDTYPCASSPASLNSFSWTSAYEYLGLI